jgi:hypothetical protein
VLDGYNGKQVSVAGQDMLLKSRQQQKTRIWCRQRLPVERRRR